MLMLRALFAPFFIASRPTRRYTMRLDTSCTADLRNRSRSVVVYLCVTRRASARYRDTAQDAQRSCLRNFTLFSRCGKSFMKKVLEGFKEFVLQGNVVSMAVGIIIGAAFGKIVDAFVKGIIDPLLGALVGEPNFDQLHVGPINYGLVVTAAINFLLVAAVIYFFFVDPMNKLLEKEEEEAAEAPPEPTREEILLEEIRDALVNRPL